MIVGVPKETYEGERRVALVPASVAALGKKQVEVVVETGAGVEAGFPDSIFEKEGARLVDRAELFKTADVVAQVRGYGANLGAGRADLELLRPGQAVIGFLEPLSEPKAVQELGPGVEQGALSPASAVKEAHFSSDLRSRTRRRFRLTAARASSKLVD